MTKTANIAWVLGASGFLGNAAVQWLQSQSYRVIGHHCHHPSRATESIQANWLEDGAVNHFFDAAIVHGVPLVVIHAASLLEKDRCLGYDWEMHTTLHRIHCGAPMALNQRLWEYHQSHPTDTPSVIIHCLDSGIPSGPSHTRAFGAYLASKKAVWQAIDHTAPWFAPHLRLHAIALGGFHRHARQSNAHFDAWSRDAPLKEPSSMSAIFSAIRYLMDAAHTIGQCLFVDGGRHTMGALFEDAHIASAFDASPSPAG